MPMTIHENETNVIILLSVRTDIVVWELQEHRCQQTDILKQSNVPHRRQRLPQRETSRRQNLCSWQQPQHGRNPRPVIIRRHHPKLKRCNR